MDTANLGLNLWKLWAKINLSYFKLFLLGICHGDKKSKSIYVISLII
jgi:hypothetical protein